MLTVVRGKLRGVPSNGNGNGNISCTPHCHGEHGYVCVCNRPGVIPDHSTLGHAWLFVLKTE